MFVRLARYARVHRVLGVFSIGSIRAIQSPLHEYSMESATMLKESVSFLQAMQHKILTGGFAPLRMTWCVIF
jgi:hypothetical protein